MIGAGTGDIPRLSLYLEIDSYNGAHVTITAVYIVTHTNGITR